MGWGVKIRGWGGDPGWGLFVSNPTRSCVFSRGGWQKGCYIFTQQWELLASSCRIMMKNKKSRRTLLTADDTKNPTYISKVSIYARMLSSFSSSTSFLLTSFPLILPLSLFLSLSLSYPSLFLLLLSLHL